jgi:cytochrome c553/mono/diheme cytochrome c family protein
MSKNSRPQILVLVSVLILAPALRAGPGPVAAGGPPAASSATGGPPVATAEHVEFFEKKVRPLLVENCQRCHGAATKQRGNLRLDSRAGVLKGGDDGPAVVPGNPEASLLLKAVRYTDPDLRMPPKGRLSAEQVADLAAWVRMGAPWPDETGARPAGKALAAFDLHARLRHWSFQPLHVGSPPAVRHADWVRTPVDRFILAKLEAAGLTPAPPADKRTLIRRVTYDLIGLPPTPAEIAAFLADDSPEAFARVVDRLLASPHYGERWGRHWLDLVRFAETCGHEFDIDMPEAYRYRDYVIRAFNDDLPYDRFVTEQVAGDLLPRPRRHPTEGFNESIVGTGFWYLGESVHSPVDVRADQDTRIDNQIDVFSKAFLGLTMACARCHDHKFDPISTRDYYALAGYLQSSRLQHAAIDPPGPAEEIVRRLRELHERGRALAVPATADALAEQAGHMAENLLATRTTPTAGRKLPDLLRPWQELAGPGPDLSPEQFAARRQELVRQLRSEAPRAAEQGARCTVFADFRRDGFRDWFVTGAAFGTAPSTADDVVLQDRPGRLVSRLVGVGVAHSGLLSGKLQGTRRSRTFTIRKKKILYHAGGRGTRINLIVDGYQHIRDPIYGGLTVHLESGDRLQWYTQDVSMWVGQRAYVEVLDEGDGFAAVDRILFAESGPPLETPNSLLTWLLDDPRLTTPPALARKYQALCLEIVGQWRAGTLGQAADAPERIAVLNAMLQDERFAPPAASTTRQTEDAQKLAALLHEQKRLEEVIAAPHRVLAMADGTGLDERVHIRGNHKTLGAEVPRRFLEALAGDHQPAPGRGSGRRELARRMVDPSDPLLPRVLVNRLWQHHFGEGLVRSVDNFGVLGERPTHPELLDWLAAEFVRGGWSIKRMHRLLLLSNAYQMASRSDPRADERDPQNLRLHRMPLRRLEAECIRDALLAVSGRLDRKMYGRGVLPYLTEYMAGRGRPASGPLDGDGRRSIYINVRRNFLTPLFLAFDYPVPFTTMGRRTVSNVPAQALALMNNPFVLQQARLWARRTLERPATARQRVACLYEEAFGRPPTPDERDDALAFLKEQGEQYGRADDPRAWTDLCHVLINVKEFIFVE